MPSIILMLPIVAGKVEAWRRFCQEMAGSRGMEHEVCRLGQGITRERLALIVTEFGSAAIATIEAEDIAQALSKILTSELPFDRWYRAQIQALHGIHMAAYEQFAQQPVLVDNQEMLFEWVLHGPQDNGYVTA